MELLAYLIHNAEQEIRTEKMIADLWPDKDSEKASNLLYTNLCHLRKVLDACGLSRNLVKIPSGYLFRKDGIFCDEWLVEEYRQGRKNVADVGEIISREYLEDVYSDWVIDARLEYESLLKNSRPASAQEKSFPAPAAGRSGGLA